MVIAAIVSERLVGATPTPSAFGGARARAQSLVARIDPVTLAVAEDGVDVGRWLAAWPEGAADMAPGDPRRVGALLRPLSASAGDNDDVSDVDCAGVDDLAAAFARRLRGLDVAQLRLPKRFFDAADGDLFIGAAVAAGVEVKVLEPPTAGAILFVDDAELVLWPGLTPIMHNGQRATLAAGLARDVVAGMIAAAGAAGAAVWDGGFDVVARALFVQRVERRIRQASGAQVHLDLAEILPPLSASTSKAKAVAALPQPSVRAIELAAAHRRQQRVQWASLRRLRFDLRLPEKIDSWWVDRIAAVLEACAGAEGRGAIDVVGADTVELRACEAALLARGVVVHEPDLRWLLGPLDAGAGPAVARSAGDGARSAPAPGAARVGGVRAAAAEVLLRPTAATTTTSPTAATTTSPPSSSSSSVSSLTPEPPQPPSPLVPEASTPESVDWRRVLLPVSDAHAHLKELVVLVDGVAIDDVEVVEGSTPEQQVLILPPRVRAGSVVSVGWGRQQL